MINIAARKKLSGISLTAKKTEAVNTSKALVFHETAFLLNLLKSSKKPNNVNIIIPAKNQITFSSICTPLNKTPIPKENINAIPRLSGTIVFFPLLTSFPLSPILKLIFLKINMNIIEIKKTASNKKKFSRTKIKTS